MPPHLDAGCALFLDVDGTLLDFAPTPDEVALPEGALPVITRLSELLGGALALVSGRPLHELDRVFAPLQLPAAGLHGQELRGAPAMAAAAPSQAMQTLRAAAVRLAQQHPGVVIEDKGGNIALHWRKAPEAGAHVTALAQAHIGQLAGYRLQPGDHVVEVVPANVDKGRAVQALMRQAPFAGRRPVFVGDDLTDEYGFTAANALGGWSVLVGQRTNSHAIYHLPDTGAVHDWLRRNTEPGPTNTEYA
ncbi:trehalose-phosphatase [Pseudoxanthomonas composti]